MHCCDQTATDLAWQWTPNCPTSSTTTIRAAESVKRDSLGSGKWFQGGFGLVVALVAVLVAGIITIIIIIINEERLQSSDLQIFVMRVKRAWSCGRSNVSTVVLDT